MNKKQLIVTLLTLFFVLPVFAANIPQELQLLGFTQDKLVDYRRAKDNIEYFTFSDWTTERKGDTITFIVERGQITGKFKDENRKVLDKDI
ncbi:MAG: hypothetical protein WCI77_07695 [Candidatus Omnitrophota bacterium]